MDKKHRSDGEVEDRDLDSDRDSVEYTEMFAAVTCHGVGYWCTMSMIGKTMTCESVGSAHGHGGTL